MFLSILYPSTCNPSINTYIVCDLNFIFMKNDVIRITIAPIYRKTRICVQAITNIGIIAKIFMNISILINPSYISSKIC